MLVKSVDFINPHPSIPKCTSGLAKRREEVLLLGPKVAKPTDLGCQGRRRLLTRRRGPRRCGSGMLFPSGMQVGVRCLRG